MPKIVQFAFPPGGTQVQVADNLPVALDIETTAGEDFILIDTETSAENMVLCGGNFPVLIGSNQRGPRLRDGHGSSAVPGFPVYTFRGDTDTGMTHLGTSNDDALALVAGGVEGIRLTESGGTVTVAISGPVAHTGNIEIENASPTLTLDNSTSENASGGRESTIRWSGKKADGTAHYLAEIVGAQNGSSDNQAGVLTFAINTGSSGTSLPVFHYFDSSGCVGFNGQADSSHRLSLFGGDSNSSLLIRNTSSADGDGTGSATLHFQRKHSGGTTSSAAKIIASHDGTAQDDKGKLVFQTNAGSGVAERMRITNDGKITTNGEASALCKAGGIHLLTGTQTGVTAPSDAQDLVVEGNDNTGISIITPTNRAGFLYFVDASTGGTPDGIKFDQGTGSMRFQVANSERVRIDNKGQVGIGTLGDATAMLETQGNFGTQGAGTLESISTATVTGSGTSFTTVLKPGDAIRFTNNAAELESRTVKSVTSDTELVLTETPGATTDTRATKTYFIDPTLMSIVTGDDVSKFVAKNSRIGINTASPEYALHVTGPGGPTGLTGISSSTTLFLDNSNLDGSDRCSLVMNTDGGNGSQLDMYQADTRRFLIQAAASSQNIDFSGKLSLRATAGTVRMGIDSDGPVWVGPSSTSLSDKEFEVNNGTQRVEIDLQGTTSAINFTGNNNATRQELTIGTSQGPGIIFSKYGIATARYQLGQTEAWDDDQTNANRSAYLADSNTDLIIDMAIGNAGVITLVDNIDKIKFYNVPAVGRVINFTLRITQNASAAKTVSYSTIEFYTDSGSSAVSGTATLQWAGGVTHTMSTGTSDIDIVQFTSFSDTSNTVQIYGAVIGQNFS